MEAIFLWISVLAFKLGSEHTFVKYFSLSRMALPGFVPRLQEEQNQAVQISRRQSHLRSRVSRNIWFQGAYFMVTELVKWLSFTF